MSPFLSVREPYAGLVFYVNELICSCRIGLEEDLGFLRLRLWPLPQPGLLHRRSYPIPSSLFHRIHVRRSGHFSFPTVTWPAGCLPRIYEQIHNVTLLAISSAKCVAYSSWPHFTETISPIEMASNHPENELPYFARLQAKVQCFAAATLGTHSPVPKLLTQRALSSWA